MRVRVLYIVRQRNNSVPGHFGRDLEPMPHISLVGFAAVLKRQGHPSVVAPPVPSPEAVHRKRFIANGAHLLPDCASTSAAVGGTIACGVVVTVRALGSGCFANRLVALENKSSHLSHM